MKTAALIVATLLAAFTVLHHEAHAVPAGQPCDGIGAVCDKGLWCEPPAGTCTVSKGICVAVPRLCIARRNSASYRPVCGCNSKTYSSDCFRRAYKVAKFHDGKC
jgi:hypothetical protein